MFVADVLFYVAVVGKVCDAGRATRKAIVAELLRLTSLVEREANELLDAMFAKNMLARRGGYVVCLIPA